MKKFLVTGGAGFIGSHLCETLLENNCFVICLDNLFTGSKKNIKHLLNNKNFSFIEHDITIPIDLDIDFILNFACPASPKHYQFNPVQTVKTNVHGSINMLDLARSKSIPILQASTSEVYGDPDVSPQVENYLGRVNPIGIRACYDEGKRCAETLFFDYSRQYETEIKIIRIFNTYGPRMQPDDGRVVSNFIVQALKGKDITIYGDGKQTRSFCYIDDLVLGIMKMSEKEKKFLGPVNLGNPNEFKVIELAKLVLKLTNSKSKIVFKKLPNDDPKQRKPSIDLALKELNWNPNIQLEVGLKKTIKYFERILKK